MPALRNKYNGKCRGCGAKLTPGVGWAVMTNGDRRWSSWCDDLSHAPSAVVQEIKAKATKLVDTTPDKLHANGVLVMAYNATKIPVVRTIPGRRWDPATKTTTVSVSDDDLAETVKICRDLQVEIAPELLARLDAIAALRDSGFVKLDGFKSVKGHELRPFQRVGVDWMRQKTQPMLLGDDMGLGKTAQVLLSLPVGTGTVVVAPNAVKYNWRTEAQNWRPDLVVTMLEGRDSFRWPESNEIVVTGFAILPNLVMKKENKYTIEGGDQHAVDLLANPPTAFSFVVDEVHRAKNSRTLRGVRCRALAKLASRVVGMTGTPLANRPPDLWGTLMAINAERDTFRSWTNFVEVFDGIKDKYGYQWGMPKAVVPNILERVMLRRRKNEVARELPPKTYTEIIVPLSDNDLIRDLDEMMGEVDLESNCLPDLQDFSRIRAALATSRAPVVIELLEDYEESDEAVVVFSAHKEVLRRIAEAKPDFAIITGETSAQRRNEIVDAFQAGQYKGLLCTIQAAGVGLTMTRASIELFVDLSWVPADNWQAEDRVCRIGQNASSVQIVRLSSNHPLDQHVHKLLCWKQELIANSIDAESIKFAPTPQIDTASIAQVLASAEAELAKELRDADIDAAIAEGSNDPATKRLVARRKLTRHGATLRGRYTEESGKETFPEVTDELRIEIAFALGALSSVCDGAVEKDGVGFNSPDAKISKWFIEVSGLTEDEDVLAALGLVYKYKRQLGGAECYPAIYG